MRSDNEVPILTVQNGHETPPPTPDQPVIGPLQRTLPLAKAVPGDAEPPAQGAMAPASGENASFRAINFSACYPLSVLEHRFLLISLSLLTTRYGWHLVGDFKPGESLPPYGLEACSLPL